MDLQSFALGIVSVIMLCLISVVVFTFVKVQRMSKRTNSSFESLHIDIARIKETHFKSVEDLNSQITRRVCEKIDQRFDKFANRLNSSCFKEKDEKLYS